MWGLVSILTRPEGRVLRIAPRIAPARRCCFNPHPTRRPGATVGAAACGGGQNVSILTRPEGRVLPVREPGAPRCVSVSILTRPEGRVLPLSTRSDGDTYVVSILTRPEGRVLPHALPVRGHKQGFQSSPDPKAGCYGLAIAAPACLTCFNPHPTRRPGATVVESHVVDVAGVSILTRPEGRVLPSGAEAQVRMAMFQSSPDPKAGCYPMSVIAAVPP